ncbi:CDI domain-containing protein [Cephalotus follicularis]|uniref:Cyclin-dependent kinase inhibitor n=1 Tax=Cephalotus follicularis TaxID=3775 RepID=A0A1Q3CKT0_CEPFO|nr:CDI domain-containing protein [Cephalotus follicularis]GAV82479.1 CDI domain-containing protein [Cephalotus follicularis]
MMEMPQLGIKTRTRDRAPAVAMATITTSIPETTVKKRKRNDAALRISASYIQLRSRRITLRDSISPSLEASNANSSGTVSSPIDERTVSVSCCSNNGSSQQVNEIIKCIDLEDKNESVEVETSTYYSCREEERRETTPSSELGAEESYDLDSTARPPSMAEENSGVKSTAEKMTTASELEEFFSAAERNIQKQFLDKYNYDIVKDEPVEGRYEWVRLSP